MRLLERRLGGARVHSRRRGAALGLVLLVHALPASADPPTETAHGTVAVLDLTTVAKLNEVAGFLNTFVGSPPEGADSVEVRFFIEFLREAVRKRMRAEAQVQVDCSNNVQIKTQKAKEKSPRKERERIEFKFDIDLRNCRPPFGVLTTYRMLGGTLETFIDPTVPAGFAEVDENGSTCVPIQITPCQIGQTLLFQAFQILPEVDETGVVSLCVVPEP